MYDYLYQRSDTYLAKETPTAAPKAYPPTMDLTESAYCRRRLDDFHKTWLKCEDPPYTAPSEEDISAAVRTFKQDLFKPHKVMRAVAKVWKSAVITCPDFRVWVNKHSHAAGITLRDSVADASQVFLTTLVHKLYARVADYGESIRAAFTLDSVRTEEGPQPQCVPLFNLHLSGDDFQ